MTYAEILHFHLFCGLGGGAKGFNRSQARLGTMAAEYRCIGGIDSDAAAVRDFEAAVQCAGTVLDLFDREQYIAWHGHEPPLDWREATPADIQRAAGYERPHIIFTSPPCKGFSGLLNSAKAASDRYAALNRLTTRGIWLALEAWKDDPPEFFLLENVPRIATRGLHLLDQIEGMLRAYGYAVARTTHDCGELGGLAQTRKRFLLVARHQEKVPPFLYEPPKRPLRAVGDILGRMPLPGDPVAGPMHNLPRLHWRTWVRLAFVEAGKDWRSLERLRVVDGHLADYLIVPAAFERGPYGVLCWEEHARAIAARSMPTNGRFTVADPRLEDVHHRVLGVTPWNKHQGTVAGASRPQNGAYSVQDPRFAQSERWNDGQQFGVMGFDETAGTITGQKSPGQGRFAVADPRPPAEGRFNNVYRVVPFDAPSPAVTAGGGPTAGGLAVADPRPPARDDYKSTKYRVTAYDEPAGAVIAASHSGNGAFAVGDPRCNWSPTAHRNKFRVVDWDRPGGTVTGSQRCSSGALAVGDPRVGMASDRECYKTAGHYGVTPWDEASRAVTGSVSHDNGPGNVADPRPPLIALPNATDRGVFVIQALDGTWHRPFTTLELAALQSLVTPEECWGVVALDGTSDSAHRERIGNMVPPDAAQAIGSVIGHTLLLAWTGESFMLSSTPVWVRPLAIALSVRTTP